MKIDLEPQPKFGGYLEEEWKGTSLAVIAAHGGEGVILWRYGAHIDLAVEEWVCSTLGDYGLDDVPDGLSIWEGRMVGGEWMPGCEDYADVYLEGKFRPPTEVEWEAIMRNESPWKAIEAKRRLERFTAAVGALEKHREVCERCLGEASCAEGIDLRSNCERWKEAP